MDEIEICERCKGFGLVEFDVGTHNSEYETEECGACKGSGRITVDTTIKRKPFVPGKSQRLYQSRWFWQVKEMRMKRLFEKIYQWWATKQCKDCKAKMNIKDNPTKDCYWLLLNRYKDIDNCKHYKRKRWKLWRPKKQEMKK